MKSQDSHGDSIQLYATTEVLHCKLQASWSYLVPSSFLHWQELHSTVSIELSHLVIGW